MNNNTILIYCGVVMAIYFFVAKVLPIIKKGKKLFSKYIVNPKADPTIGEYRKLLVGAIFGEQQSAYINSLTTGVDKSRLDTFLTDWWGIESEKDAKDTLNNILDQGYRYYYPAIIKAFNADESKHEAIITNYYDQNSPTYNYDIERTHELLGNLKGLIEALKDNDFLKLPIDLEKHDPTGWDCGRLVLVSRMAYDGGFLTEDEAQYHIDNAYKLATATFKNWEDLAKSYVIGRGLWAGANYDTTGIITIAKDLLTDEKSPWLQTSLK